MLKLTFRNVVLGKFVYSFNFICAEKLEITHERMIYKIIFCTGTHEKAVTINKLASLAEEPAKS